MSNLYPKCKIRDVPGKQRDKFKLGLNLLSDRQSFNCKDRLQSLAQQENENIVVQRLLYSWFGSFFWFLCAAALLSHEMFMATGARFFFSS